MGKHWRNLGASCKMAGGLGEEEICKAKIRLIFVGAESDVFINDFENIDMSKHGFNMKRGIPTVLETKESFGVLKEKYMGGYEYKLKEEYQKNVYILELLAKEKSLFFTKDAYVKCAMGKKKESIRISDSFIGISPKHFFSKYILDGYLTIIVELALNIRINCKMEGASETIIYKKDNEKESLIVPLNYKSGYYAKDFLAYPKKVIARSANSFQEFFSTSDGSIGFKAVNYRKNIYTGDKNHVLQGGNLNANPISALASEIASDMFDHKYKNLFLVPFTTGVEKKFYHAELIENKVFILLECLGKYYTFTEYAYFEITEDIKNISMMIEKGINIYQTGIGNPNKSIQFIFFHLEFDGKKIEYKDVRIDSTKFNQHGKAIK